MVTFGLGLEGAGITGGGNGSAYVRRQMSSGARHGVIPGRGRVGPGEALPSLSEPWWPFEGCEDKASDLEWKGRGPG